MTTDYLLQSHRNPHMGPLGPSSSNPNYLIPTLNNHSPLSLTIQPAFHTTKPQYLSLDGMAKFTRALKTALLNARQATARAHPSPTQGSWILSSTAYLKSRVCHLLFAFLTLPSILNSTVLRTMTAKLITD